MTSRRSERLVNLTMALLATRRYLTKSEIFRSVEGYEGSPESKERMFERDKDALRSLGINIDLRGVDPTFEDEPGYRILPESYSLNLGQLTGSELAALSLAAEAWRGAALGESAQSALLKLKSLGIASDFDALPLLSPKIGIASTNFKPVTDSIADKKMISFDYPADNLTIERRLISPFGLGSRKGNWYLVGFDEDRNDLRTFRLDRIRDEIRIEKTESRTADSNFNVLEFLDSQLFDIRHQAIIKVRRGKCHSLRVGAELVSATDDFETLKIGYSSESHLLDEILWHGDDVVLLEPSNIKEDLLKRLSLLVSTHE